uniref:Uncharacterized protein n=1 Tax=Rhizophora mucronata TaxID=61149 RepID=A0A2P2QJV2_RHIMU
MFVVFELLAFQYRNLCLFTVILKRNE